MREEVEPVESHNREYLLMRIKELEEAFQKEKNRINAALGDDLHHSIEPWAVNVAISILKLKNDTQVKVVEQRNREIENLMKDLKEAGYGPHEAGGTLRRLRTERDKLNRENKVLEGKLDDISRILGD